MCDAKRLRQREQQSTSLFSKNNNNNKNFARAAHFLYISLPLLLQREASQLDFLGRKCVVSAHKKKQKLLLVFLFTFPFFFLSFFFLLLLIFTLLVTSISHFLTTATKFSCFFFPTKFVSFAFHLQLQLSVPLLLPTFSFSLPFSISKFVKMATYLSLILQTTQIQKQFPLPFLSGYGRLLIL